MRISDWSSDVCSSDLAELAIEGRYGHDASGPGGTEAQAALDAFIGCGDSGDPDWASRDIHEFRSEAAARKLAAGRSEARRVGKECVSTCRYRWSPST